jgi:hypothetical protein
MINSTTDILQKLFSVHIRFSYTLYGIISKETESELWYKWETGGGELWYKWETGRANCGINEKQAVSQQWMIPEARRDTRKI